MNIKFENLEKIDEVLNILLHLKSEHQDSKRWLNIKEASHYLGYSKDYIHSLKNDEFIEGKHYYKKGKLLFDRLELDNWVTTSSNTNINSKEVVNQILKDLV